MPARLIAYPPDAAAVSRWLQPPQRLRIGRDPGCDVVIDHPSVSRAHAELYHRDDRWWLRDLGSKNGSFVDGIAVADHPLPGSCWLRFGDTYCDFGEFEAQQAEALRSRQADRRALSQAMAVGVSQQPGSDSLPAHVLRGVIELSGCTRGFMLLANPRVGDFIVRASLQFDVDTLAQSQPLSSVFSGSIGAVQKVIATGKPLVVNDIGNEAWLSSRASVVSGGLKTLVCLPLFDGRKVFGAVYADRRGPGEPITDFDLELLGAFAESATLYLLTRLAIDSIDDAPRWQSIVERKDPATPTGTAT